MFGALFGGLLVIFDRQLLSIFTSSEEVIDAGVKRIQIMGYSYAFSALMDNTIAASRGLGKTIVPTIIVISGSCIFRIAWIYTIFAHYHTIKSLYLLYFFSWMITVSSN
ncbi:MAG: MATE family efflux transporter [Bacilli bacterium]